ncbi:MAG: hypothetical protein IJ677_02085 [Alphaproteobacteria bacterium]|nr:hypothetical protein [Alphaproteobacteria bacterium]
MKADESGRSMIEMLGVIAIIGILTVGGIAGYSKAMEKWRINKTANQISYIVAHLRGLYRGQMDYRGLDSTTSYAVIDTAKAFPPEMGEKGTYHNPFSGTVTVKAAGKDTVESKDDEGNYLSYNDDTAFILTYTGVPRSACIGLATIDWGTGSNGGLVALGVNIKLDKVSLGHCVKSSNASTSKTLGNAIICEGNGVMGPVDASIGCSSEGNNTLYFKFY